MMPAERSMLSCSLLGLGAAYLDWWWVTLWFAVLGLLNWWTGKRSGQIE